MEKQRKTIQINPDFFKIGKRTRKQKQAKKRSDLRQTIKPNNLKKQLLTRIKNHQQEHEKKNKQSDTDNLDKFQNDHIPLYRLTCYLMRMFLCRMTIPC